LLSSDSSVVAPSSSWNCWVWSFICRRLLTPGLYEPVSV
jgi:hypothetical protein